MSNHTYHAGKRGSRRDATTGKPEPVAPATLTVETKPEPAEPVRPIILDTKSGRPLVIANAHRVLGTILRLLGILVNFEPYKNVTINGSIYHSRFTFTGKNPTGNFTAVIARLVSVGFTVTTDRVQLAADHGLSKYNPKIPVFSATLTGSAGSPVHGFKIVVFGSDNPETGLIPIYHVVSHPATASVAPKQNDKSSRASVSADIDFSEPAVESDEYVAKQREIADAETEFENFGPADNS